MACFVKGTGHIFKKEQKGARLCAEYCIHIITCKTPNRPLLQKAGDSETSHQIVWKFNMELKLGLSIPKDYTLTYKQLKTLF